MALSASSPWAAAAVLACCALCVNAADASPATDECFSSASVVGAVLGTAIVLLGLEGGAYMLWRLYWRSRRGQHLVLVTDPEKGGEYAFDNPCFKDATPVSKSVLEPAKVDQKNNKWTSWGGAIRNNLGGLQGEKRRAMDDSFTAATEPQVTQVLLRSHDFTGLGFNICGNMRDGIFVKDVLHRGPASESKLVFPGDRIHGIRISLRHMVFEDALTILSYASPYEVTLEVETGTAQGASSRPSSLLRREKEKEALASLADRIVHPFYRSQSIADLAQIGKTTHKRALDSPSRSEHGDYPTLKLHSSQASPKHAAHAAQAPMLHTSTPHAHARLEQAAAVIKPERSVVHKLGVRVLPEPTEKRQNVHNTYLERGIDVPDGYNPYAQPAQRASPQEGFHDVDLGGDRAAEEHHKVGVVAKEVKTKISKGFHNLLHSLDRNKKSAVEARTPSPPPPVAHDAAVQAAAGTLADTTNSSMAVNTSFASTEAEVMTRKPSGRGIPTEIPEEVRLAAMAARSNRKSLGALSVEVIESATLGEADRAAASPGSSERLGVTKRKGLAPRPPSVTPVAAEVSATPSSASPSSLASSPASVALVNGMSGDESLLSLQSLRSLPMHSDSESEADCPLAGGPGGLSSGPRTTIELTSSHVTVHHSHGLGLDEDTTRKAASLGDLSRIGDKLAGVAVLERAVSLDLDAPSHGKKRKAPAAPAAEADDLDDDLSLDAMDDAGVYGMARKEPRLDMVGVGMNTFERSRLKKSSDWGTLEEALASDKDGGQVQVLTSTAPTVAEVHPKGELKNSFFVGGIKFGPSSTSEEQPFSFTASSMEPLSIEVRAEASTPVPAAVPSPRVASASSDSPDRDRVLWSVPGEDGQAGASRVSVNPPRPADAADAVDVVEVTGTDPVSGPTSLSSLTIVSSTPMRPSYDATRDAVQSPLVSSSEVNRALVSSTSAAFVSTTQLNSLELDTADAAFLTAVDSSTLMMDAADSLDSDDEVTASSPPDLPTSPVPMSSLTYVTEIQVTTPDSSKVHNGFSSPSPRSSSPAAVAADTPKAAEVTVSPSSSPELSTLEQSVLNVNGDVHVASPSPPAALPSSLPTASPAASPAASPSSSPTASPTAAPSSPTASPTASAPTTPPKAGRNVSVTAIQGSRIPVRSASHSPDDRSPAARGAATAGGNAGSAASSPATSPLRPPVPARRSGDLTPRKANGANGANGVQIVSTQQAP